jgi:transposase
VSVSGEPKRFLTAEQKYDLWVRMLTGQITQSDAAAEVGVDRTTIATLRKVARDGAIAALQASRPGQRKISREEASELAKLRPRRTGWGRW